MSKKIIIEFSQKALKALIENENSCVTLHKSVYNLALYPYHLSDLNSSIRELLHVKFAKYEKELGGILLGYKNVKILSPQGRIVTDSCFIHLNIEADFYIFQPVIGAKLNGIVNKKSKDHVGCLVHRVFNVSVPNRKEEEYWLGYNVEIGEEVILQVIYLNLDAPLPYIRAKFLSAATVTNDADITDGNDIHLKQIKDDKNFEKLEFSQNIDDINISGINEIEPTSEKKKKNKLKKYSLDNIKVEDTVDSSSQNINIKTPKDKKNKKSSRKSSEINEEQPTTEILNEESPQETKHKKSRKSLEAIEYMVTNETLNSTSNTLDNETLKAKKSKKSRKSFEISDNIDKNLNASLTAEILNNVTPKDKKRKKSKISLEVIDNPDQNINLSKTNSEITPKNKRKNTETDFNTKQIKAEIGATPKIKAEICATMKIKAETYVTPKVKKELGVTPKVKKELGVTLKVKEEPGITPKVKKEPAVTPKVKSEKRKSKTPVDNLKQSFKIEKSTPVPSDQHELWATILHQMYDSELENTLGNSSTKSHKNDTANTIESIETPKNKKRKHSFSDLEDSGNKRKKRKHSISEFQETALAIDSPKKKHKSKKTDK